MFERFVATGSNEKRCEQDESDRMLFVSWEFIGNGFEGIKRSLVIKWPKRSWKQRSVEGESEGNLPLNEEPLSADDFACRAREHSNRTDRFHFRRFRSIWKIVRSDLLSPVEGERKKIEEQLRCFDVRARCPSVRATCEQNEDRRPIESVVFANVSSTKVSPLGRSTRTRKHCKTFVKDEKPFRWTNLCRRNKNDEDALRRRYLSRPWPSAWLICWHE